LLLILSTKRPFLPICGFVESSLWLYRRISLHHLQSQLYDQE
jgi:hypothetical protein